LVFKQSNVPAAASSVVDKPAAKPAPPRTPREADPNSRRSQRKLQKYIEWQAIIDVRRIAAEEKKLRDDAAAAASAASNNSPDVPMELIGATSADYYSAVSSAYVPATENVSPPNSPLGAIHLDDDDGVPVSLAEERELLADFDPAVAANAIEHMDVDRIVSEAPKDN